MNLYVSTTGQYEQRGTCALSGHHALVDQVAMFGH